MPGCLSIIIPAYNERATVETLLRRVLKVALPIEREIIVVESNSEDGTREVVRRFERDHGVKAIFEDRPRGKGEAVKAGLAAATGDWVLIQDADLEYDVEDYPALLEPLVSGQADFVMGSRVLGRKRWRIRGSHAGRSFGRILDLGGRLYTGLFNLLYGVSLTDPATMYKVFRRSCLDGIRLQSNRFDLDWEIVAKLVRKGIVPREIPVRYQARSVREGKKIRFWRDGWQVFRAIVRFRFSPL